jgi:hypothetical protein
MPSVSGASDDAQPPDVNDTSGCPRGHRCESCGTEHGDLAVETMTHPRLGTLCLTMCRRCAAFGQDVPVSLGTATRLVEQHLEHIGVDR